MADQIRLAILGCGAISRSAHLPAVVAHPGVRLCALVDADVKRAQALARSHRLDCECASDYRPVLEQVDAIINALPNHLHAAVTLDALRAGVHVLCEKPLATTAHDALSCCEMAEQKKLVLAAGMNRRFAASHLLLRLLLDERQLGSLLDYDCQYGGAFDWKSASAFYFSRALAGGGVLIDSGVHLLDSLVNWFGPVSRFAYQDDNWGSGIEANAVFDLQHSGKYGEVRGRVQVSRTYTLKNRLLVRGSDAQAEVAAAELDCVTLHRTIGGRNVSESLRLEDHPMASTYDRQLDNFIASIKNHQPPEVDGRQALRIIELIENCYANARRLPEPWSEVPVWPSEARA